MVATSLCRVRATINVHSLSLLKILSSFLKVCVDFFSTILQENAQSTHERTDN